MTMNLTEDALLYHYYHVIMICLLRLKEYTSPPAQMSSRRLDWPMLAMELVWCSSVYYLVPWFSHISSA